MKNVFAGCCLLLALGACSVFKKQPKDDLVTITTDVGTIDLVLFDATPKHKANFEKLAKSKFYDGTTFHRVIDNFMIQGGDPNSKDANPANDGSGENGYTVPAEFAPGLTHVQGAVAAARMGDDVNPKKESSGCQFYIVENKEGTHFLDNNYTVFGQVVKGMETVERIAEQKKNAADRPLKDIKMTVQVKRLTKASISKTYGYTYPAQ